jgi:hypothetical protein
MAGYQDIVEILIEKGASLSERNWKNLTPLEVTHHSQIRKILEGKKKKKNCKKFFSRF